MFKILHYIFHQLSWVITHHFFPRCVKPFVFKILNATIFPSSNSSDNIYIFYFFPGQIMYILMLSEFLQNMAQFVWQFSIYDSDFNICVGLFHSSFLISALKVSFYNLCILYISEIFLTLLLLFNSKWINVNI